MCKFPAIAALCFLSFCTLPAQSLYCWVDVNDDVSERQPLVLEEHSNDFVYPKKSNSDNLKIGFCEKIRVICPQDQLAVLGSNLNVSEATLKCYGLSFFDVVGTSYAAPFELIGCTRDPVATAGLTESKCPNGTIGRIGFELDNGVFLPTIAEICHNEKLGQTHWVRYQVSLAVCKRQSNSGVPKYIREPFYPNITITPSLYTKDSQRQRLTELLNDTALVNMYIPETGDNYLVEGQLAPRDDMFYRSQQDSTFYYANTVPMWKSVRDGNWRLVEDIARQSACRDSVNLDLQVGGIGVLAYDDVQSNATEITLTDDTAGNPAIPAPRFLYKRVFVPLHNRGVVFVTLNDPHVKAVLKEHEICEPYATCSELYPQFNVATMGYTYCCSIEDFDEIVDRGQSNLLGVKPLF